MSKGNDDSQTFERILLISVLNTILKQKLSIERENYWLRSKSGCKLDENEDKIEESEIGLFLCVAINLFQLTGNIETINTELLSIYASTKDIVYFDCIDALVHAFLQKETKTNISISTTSEVITGTGGLSLQSKFIKCSQISKFNLEKQE